MKRIIIALFALAFAPAAFAQLYKYVDKDGKTVYSDQPPANVESKQISVPTGGNGPGKTAVARDKEVEKSRTEVREKEKKAAESEKRAADAEYRCSLAKAAYKTYQEGGRIRRYNAKGELEYLDDGEIEAGRDKSRREMEEACKKS
jgi:hypothetical protein